MREEIFMRAIPCFYFSDRIAESFEMPEGHRGNVKVKKPSKNKGLRAAWFEAWYPKPDDHYCVIIEDDLEVSPFWFTWLRKAWSAYSDRTDIAGIALQVCHRHYTFIGLHTFIELILKIQLTRNNSS